MKKEEIKISVVIPVYNVEKYLHQCVDSVLSQTYKNIEVILVDDGSPDNSPAICDDYANRDSRVRVIHKVNGGLSSARNAGIRAVTGDYIMFLDSDDFWEELVVLEGIVNKIIETRAEVICFGYKEYFDDTQKYGKSVDVSNFYDYCNDDMLYSMISKGVYTSSAWSKAVKKDIVLGNDIFFNEGITSEDIDWSARILIYSNSYAVYPNSFYIYRQRQGSIVHNIKYENLKMLADNIKRCVDLGQDIDDENLRDLYNNYVSYQYITFLRVTAIVWQGDVETRMLVKEMKSLRWLLDYHLNLKIKMVYYFNKFFGYNIMFKLLKIYSKVK